ncbi:MAG TPA: hypothetical protein VF474_16925 [Phenylobacterium sp.]
MRQTDQAATVLHDVGVAGIKLALPTGAVLLGFTLHDWAAIGTLLYLALQSAYLSWKWHRDWRRARREGRS